MSPSHAVWVVMRAVHPSWCTLQLPGEVAEVLGCLPEDLSKLNKPARAVAFLERGPGTVRVIGVHRSAPLMAQEMAKNRVIGTAQMTDKGVFNIPDAVEQHLDLTVFPRGEHGASGTDDTLAWLLPEEEYYRYRQQEKSGKPPAADGREFHVYLVKSLFPGLRPSVEVMEGSGSAPSRPFLARTPASRRTSGVSR